MKRVTIFLDNDLDRQPLEEILERNGYEIVIRENFQNTPHDRVVFDVGDREVRDIKDE